MPFPQFAPSSREFKAGDFPVKNYRALDGSELRILYGSKRTGFTLRLGYNNLSDTDAEKFIEHFHEMKGTFTGFYVSADQSTSASTDGPKKGWGGNQKNIGARDWGNQWRYAEPPTVTSVYPGVSSVSVTLVGVLRGSN